ncbi:MAG TPA: response regulator [Anaeromyxobacter sp.]|nr:response regulator [Anaeromyxobacter sp.]
MPDLAAHLVRSGVLPPDAAARALAAAHDGDVGSAALRLGLATESALAKALADLYGCPAVDFSKSVVPTANLDVVAAGFCRQRHVLAVSVSRTELVLAMADPDDYALADEVRFVTGRAVLRYAAVPAAIERTLDALVRERGRGHATWRGGQAPALPDPEAAWVGVVHGAKKPEAGLDLPEITSTMEIVVLSEQVERTPFSAPSPARRERPPEHAVRPPPPQATTGEATVRLVGAGALRLALVADASPEAREEIAGLLGGLGCTVLQAANGRAALDVVREARPELVIIDAMLPMTPGFEVCRAVKGDPVLRPTAVVLTSAVHRGTVAADAKVAFGADAFLEKPFRHDEVLRVAKLLLLGPAGDPAEAAARSAAEAAWREGGKLLQAGRVDEAVAVLRQAAAKDDLSAEAHFYLGHALARQGLLFEAAAAFARAAELRPDVDAAHQVLAQTYEALGFQKSAREAWARAIEVCKDEKRKGEMQVKLMQLLGM